MGLHPPTPESRGEKPEDSVPEFKGFIDADPRPTFLVPINLLAPIEFRLVFCNHAFNEAELEEEVWAGTDVAIRFRAWCQAVENWREEVDFAGKTWTAFRIQGKWKCISASLVRKPPVPVDGGVDIFNDLNVNDQRLASLYRMMEMSDVGTFEYNLEGTLLRANESWYRLSLHPRGQDVKFDFSFMQLVYPPDSEIVLNAWNRLVQGIPITFEMRWKGREYDENCMGNGIDDAQWVLSACVPVVDNEGKLISIAGNTIDIGAQKRVQMEMAERAEALTRARQSEQRFARFALLAPIGIFMLDRNQKMTYCNHRFFELAGRPDASDYDAVDWQRIIYPADVEIFREFWRNMSESKEMMQSHFRLIRTWDIGDGVSRPIWVEVLTAPELDDDGNVISMLGSMSEISRFKWAEEIQKTRMDEALEAKRKQENFIDMTSHEMRNPLSAVVQCSDSTIESLKLVKDLISQSSSSDVKLLREIDREIEVSLDSLNTIIAASMHQKRVVDDILTLSKMDSNLMAIAPVRCEAAAIVADAVHLFERECVKDGISLEFVEDASLGECRAHNVMMDPSRVLQVLINLLTNAIKFTRGRDTRRIQVILGASRTRPAQNFGGASFAEVASQIEQVVDREEWGLGQPVYLWIKCRDTGCGLSNQEQSRLFTKFSQATPRTHIRYGGSGLGLFISKRLSELQGGAIGVDSSPENGSTFIFFVHARITAPPTPQPIELPNVKELQISGLGAPNIAKPGAIKYTLLVVEDNLVNQKVLSQQLRKAGCTVYVANHGVEALDFLRTTAFWREQNIETPESEPSASSAMSTAGTATAPVELSLILMDIEMPIMDGLTCTRKIREYQASGEIVGHIPILAVSANARTEQVAQAINAGMDDTIAKPFRIPELMPKMEALVRGEGPTLVLTPSNAGVV